MTWQVSPVKIYVPEARSYCVLIDVKWCQLQGVAIAFSMTFGQAFPHSHSLRSCSLPLASLVWRESWVLSQTKSKRTPASQASNTGDYVSVNNCSATYLNENQRSLQCKSQNKTLKSCLTNHLILNDCAHINLNKTTTHSKALNQTSCSEQSAETFLSRHQLNTY